MEFMLGTVTLAKTPWLESLQAPGGVCVWGGMNVLLSFCLNRQSFKFPSKLVSLHL